MPWIAYVIQNKTGKLYKGMTSDLEKRLQYHNQDLGHWTKGRGPWHLIHHEAFETKKEALQRENFFKSGKGRAFLQQFISTGYSAVG